MLIVKWLIPIIGKLADNRPIIGAPLIIVTATSTHKCEILKTGHTMHATVC